MTSRTPADFTPATPEKAKPIEPLQNHRDEAPYPMDQSENLSSLNLTRTKTFGKFKFRAPGDEEPEDWWFASTAIPLIAATLAPLANVLSIGALVTYWRMNLIPNDGPISSWDGQLSSLVPQLDGYPFQDPGWCYHINIVSLICGFLGNVFLLLNFTNRIRYIIALPASILLWYLSCGLLIGILVGMEVYTPPSRPTQIYTQGFWYGVLSAVMYLICSMILMVNMLGYFLGHYSQHFKLTEAQRTLILQTMLFFIWLAGGAGLFNTIENRYGTGGKIGPWTYTNALYFCDVTILTVGFGDLYPTNNVARGLLFPYAVGGIIFLGLMINSLSKFAGELSNEKVIQKHADKRRQNTFRSAAESGKEYPRSLTYWPRRMSISSPFAGHRMSSGMSQKHDAHHLVDPSCQHGDGRSDGTFFNSPNFTKSFTQSVKHTGSIAVKVAAAPLRNRRTAKKQDRSMILLEEKGRFDAMRRIQESTFKFKRWTALAISVIVFAILWCVGAAVFFVTEANTQGLSYFEALYFCYVSLLTIGYGDLAPQSNAGRPFFVVWSLLAIPSMATLVNNLGDTVIAKFKNVTNVIGDFTLLPKHGIWRKYLEQHPWLLFKIQKHEEQKAEKHRLQNGFPVGPDPEKEGEFLREGPDTGLDDTAYSRGIVEHAPPTLDDLVKEEQHPLTEHELARKLTLAIQRTANTIKNENDKRYTYEEWVEFTELIRFSSRQPKHKRDEHNNLTEVLDEENNLIEWDWIGTNSPMMAGQTEPEFVLDRLCESMNRYIKKQLRDGPQRRAHRVEKLRRTKTDSPPSGGRLDDVQGQGNSLQDVQDQ